MVLFGGTFDPVHLGHVRLADAARRSVGPRTPLVFVPAARSPHKDAGPIASPADRVRMLELATADLEHTGVWTEEIDRAESSDGPSYWIDTLESARALLGDDAVIRFVIGVDQLLALPAWRRWREILEIAEPLVLARPPLEDADAILDALHEIDAWAGVEPGAWIDRVVPAPVLPYSATEIRAALARGNADVPGLDPRVLAFIKDRGLYA